MNQYRDAGVDVAAGNDLVRRIKPMVASTHSTQVLGGLGGFAGLFDLSSCSYEQPVLVTGSDGVGTKTSLALQYHKPETVGVDLVAMCVNDVIVCGATPLFFLDYISSARLDVDVAEKMIAGMVEGCQQAAMALLGGETAEMPGLYQAGDWDLAGFCVGIVEKSKIIDGSKVKPGDALIGLASSGPHANGYSLIRKLLQALDGDQNQVDDGILSNLLEPTRIYVKALKALEDHAVSMHACAHITGGGFIENLPRVLPRGVLAMIDWPTSRWPEVFHWIQRHAMMTPAEMHQVFNCGIGMILCVDARDLEKSMDCLRACGEQALELGFIKAADSAQAEPCVMIAG